MRLPRMVALLLAGCLIQGAAQAHALLVKVRADDGAIVGTVYYSDGAQAIGEFLQLVDLDAPDAPPRPTTTDGYGAFRFDGAVEGRRYRVIAEGEEGHVTEIDLVYAEGARGTLNEADAAPLPQGRPAWLIMGGALALSLIPAFWLRNRKAVRTG